MRNHGEKISLLMIYLLLTVFCFIIPFVSQATANGKSGISIFCYHRITPKPTSEYDLTPGQLETHFQFFKTNGYHPITVAQFLEYQKKPTLFPEKPVILTFDDGTKSHYTEVLPLLKKYGFKATFYIFPNATRGSKKRWLSWEELAEISKAGMDIGSHGLSHPYLTARGKMDEGQYQVWLEKELVQSKKILEEKLTIKVKTLAYPFGLYDRQVETTAIKAGYLGMLSINAGLNGPRGNPFRLKRHIMVNTIGPKSLANLLAERVLEIADVAPADGYVAVTALPVIRFRVKNTGVGTVRLEVSKYQAVLKPDAAGVYTFTIPGKLKGGFYTIIVRGKDANNNSYLNSWSFCYRPKKM
jgi:peptidoglycan/xylan/chitin deacetylase (PgdA/CDA1 family)